MHGPLSNILRRKARGCDTAGCECIGKGFGHRCLTVIHTCNLKRSIIEADLTLVNGDIDPTQIRSILIRPEHRLRAGIADAVRPIKIL